MFAQRMGVNNVQAIMSEINDHVKRNDFCVDVHIQSVGHLWLIGLDGHKTNYLLIATRVSLSITIFSKRNCNAKNRHSLYCTILMKFDGFSCIRIFINGIARLLIWFIVRIVCFQFLWVSICGCNLFGLCASMKLEEKRQQHRSTARNGKGDTTTSAAPAYATNTGTTDKYIPGYNYTPGEPTGGYNNDNNNYSMNQNQAQGCSPQYGAPAMNGNNSIPRVDAQMGIYSVGGQEAMHQIMTTDQTSQNSQETQYFQQFVYPHREIKDEKSTKFCRNCI